MMFLFFKTDSENVEKPRMKKEQPNWAERQKK